MQYARVPIELTGLVDAQAIALYVVLCRYAHRTTGRCWPSNPELAERLQASEATVRRALTQLVQAGAVERTGRQRRVLTVVPLERLTLTGDRKTEGSNAHPRAGYRSPVSDVTTANEPESTPPLRDVVTDQESEQPMRPDPDQPSLEIEVERLPEKPKPTAQACVAAFCDAYGTEPISRSAIGRMAQRFKALSATYPHDELLAAARDLGEQRIANPNAIEPFVLRSRQPRHVAAQARSGWSALAADTFAASSDPFAADV